MKYIKKNLGCFTLGAIFLSFATLMFFVNITDMKNIVENPEPGNYFIIQDFPNVGSERILKVKDVNQTEIVFYEGHGRFLLGFRLNESENIIREADKEGRLFGLDTFVISKLQIENMQKGTILSRFIFSKPRIIGAFK